MRDVQAQATATVVWLTGPPCAGKTTLAGLVAGALDRHGLRTEVLDGDVLRRTCCADLGFSAADRVEQARRVAGMARELAADGVVPVVAIVSPTHAARAAARAVLGPALMEVHVDAPTSVCEARDVKGMYAAARRGELHAFTGVSAPYEPPRTPDVHLHTDRATPAACCERVVAAVLARITPAALTG